MSKWGKGLLALLLAVALAACGQNEPMQESGGQGEAATGGGNASPQTPETSGKRTAYPLTIKDGTGKMFTFAQAPQRIVSLSPTETEVLFALGLGDRIVGVSDYDDYPEEAKTKPKMGDLQGNVEAMIAANPDLVYAGLSLNKGSADKLNELKLNLFQTNPKTVDEAIERVKLFGLIHDRQEQAEQIVSQMEKEKQQVADALRSLKPEQRKRVYIEFSPGWTVGKGEYLDDMITLAGGVNIASDLQGWKTISEESVIQADPEVIFFARAVPNLEQTIVTRGGWDKIAAIRDGRVIGLDDNLLARPGPRLTKALLDMAKALYPELVK